MVWARDIPVGAATGANMRTTIDARHAGVLVNEISAPGESEQGAIYALDWTGSEPVRYT